MMHVYDAVVLATILNTRVEKPCFQEMSVASLSVVSELTDVCQNKRPRQLEEEGD